MIKQQDAKARVKIALMALFVGTVLILASVFFVGAVRSQLWQQSMSTIRESTQQGCNTLRVQLQEEFAAMEALAERLRGYSAGQEGQLGGVVGSLGLSDNSVALYLEDGAVHPSAAAPDEAAAQAAAASGRERGIVDPHISTATGVSVFNLFVKTVLRDGAVGYLVKEYEIEHIVDSFTVSFYHDAGFSYVIDAEGSVLIRPPHPNSNKTVKNLFDMLRTGQNDAASLEQFAQALRENKTGWATFAYQGEDTVFCYLPLGLDSDWYLISIIPRGVVEAQTGQILLRTFVFIAAILAGIALLAAVYIRYANRINAKLRNQAGYIGHLYNAIPEGIALISVEEPFRTLQLNEEGLRLLHYPEQTANGAPGGTCLRELIHPEDYESVAESYRRAVLSGDKQTFENRVRRVDGSIFWAAGLVEKTLNEDGAPILIATFHDVTAEKLAAEEAEREKLQERRMLISAVSSVFPVIISLNLNRDTVQFIYTKPGVMAELGRQERYSELYHDFLPQMHPDFQEEFRQRFAPENLCKTLGSSRQEVFLEAKMRLSDGAYHWTSTQIIAVENPYSGDHLAILMCRRIDEQRHEEERQRQALQSALDSAKAASAAKSRFLSNMSHDIRTPMNAIMGMTAIACAHPGDAERVVQCLRKINLSSHHLLSLINDILDMSKIESGKLSLGEEPFNLAQLISEVGELVRPQAQEGRLELNVCLSALRDEMVLGDPLRIRQICLNILSNAVKYTPEGGRVEFRLSQAADGRGGYGKYQFVCADTGVGMSRAFLGKLFQPFERAQDTTHSRIAGTGLGMAITKNLVDLMSGDIQVESAPGQGSTFTVTLPLRLQNAPQEEVPQQWRGVRSLIVDDDLQSCEDACGLLLEMGLRAEFVVEGAAAVDRVVEARDTPDPFELILLDWKMPDLDGVETARRIRSQVGPEVPVIILTAYDWSEIEQEARAAGVTAYLSKPFYRSKICYLLGELGEEKKPAEGTAAARPDFRGRRVLLVEDNLLNREIARTLIEEMGATVEEACDGVQAVQRVANSQEGYYSLILMDIQMPVMDGYEATQAIRALARRDAARVPIVAMTANAFEEDRRKALRAGMSAHFSKPIDVQELEALLCKYLTGPDA